MKKLLGIVVLAVILVSNSAETKDTILKNGQVYEGEIIWRRYNIKLPPGEWIYMYEYYWSYSDIDATEHNLVQLEGNLVRSGMSFGEFRANGRVMSDVALAVHEVLFKNKYDGCYERSEYYLVKVFNRGTSINCLIIRHIDTNKALYQPDDPKDQNSSARLRKWIKDNDIDVPSILLLSEHCYFAPVVRDNLVCFEYSIYPELHGASKSEFTTEETSEYHRANINKYPDKKKFMEEWVKLAAHRHRIFEEQVRAKDHHKLDLNEYLVEESILATETQSSKNITKELKELSELYKEGSLTKERFEKAKKKLLN